MIWRLSDKTLETFSNSEVRMKVRVLGEELAYNKSLRQFKMFILEQPLDPNYKVGVWGNTQFFNVCIVRRRCVHSTRGWDDLWIVFRFKTSTSDGTYTHTHHTPCSLSFQN